MGHDREEHPRKIAVDKESSFVTPTGTRNHGDRFAPKISDRKYLHSGLEDEHQQRPRMAEIFTTLFYTFFFGLVIGGSYAIVRCIQQNIRRAREAQMQGTHVAPANNNVNPQVNGADANTGVPAAGANEAGLEEEAFQMPEIREITMIRIEGPDGVVNLATWDESRARVGP